MYWNFLVYQDALTFPFKDTEFDLLKQFIVRMYVTHVLVLKLLKLLIKFMVILFIIAKVTKQNSLHVDT